MTPGHSAGCHYVQVSKCLGALWAMFHKIQLYLHYSIKAMLMAGFDPAASDLICRTQCGNPVIHRGRRWGTVKSLRYVLLRHHMWRHVDDVTRYYLYAPRRCTWLLCLTLMITARWKILRINPILVKRRSFEYVPFQLIGGYLIIIHSN